MNPLKNWHLFIILSLFLLTTPSVNISTADVNLSSLQTQAINDDSNVTINSSYITKLTYTGQTVIFAGTSFIILSITLINCKVFFTTMNNTYNSTGLILISGSRMSIINSNVSYLQPNDYFKFESYGSNSISLINSTIISNPNSPNPVIQLSEAKSVYISNSNFFNTYNLFDFHDSENITIIGSNFHNNAKNVIKATNIDNFTLSNNSFEFDPNFLNKTINFNNTRILNIDFNYFYPADKSINSNSKNFPLFVTSSNRVNITGNTFSKLVNSIFIQSCPNVIINNNYLLNFNNGFWLDSNSEMINIYQNNFINGINSIILNSLNPQMHLNITLNNFYNISQVLFIKIFSASQQLLGTSVCYNYYDNFKSIDFNNDGFYDNPFITNYFIDKYPISYTFENYYFQSGHIFTKSNYREFSLLNSTSTFQLFNYSWSLLILYYSIISFLPIILILIHTKKKINS